MKKIIILITIFLLPTMVFAKPIDTIDLGKGTIKKGESAIMYLDNVLTPNVPYGIACLFTNSSADEATPNLTAKLGNGKATAFILFAKSMPTIIALNAEHADFDFDNDKELLFLFTVSNLSKSFKLLYNNIADNNPGEIQYECFAGEMNNFNHLNSSSR